jgi:hypothetical protein
VTTYSTEDGAIDPSRGIIVACIGKKRSGKSVLALWYAMHYPGDLVVLDIAGDDGPVGPDVVEVRGTIGTGDLPDRWPEMQRLYDERDQPIRMIVRYVPDPGSPTLVDDLDAMVALAMAHGECCLLVHEVGVLASANRTPPHTLRFLMHNRHGGATTGLLCGPRSQAIHPLVIAQSDIVNTFELMGQRDRQRIAENIGWDVKEFDAAVLALGPHEFLRFDANEQQPEDGAEDHRLLHFPALPGGVVAEVERWAKGERPERIRKAAQL